MFDFTKLIMLSGVLITSCSSHKKMASEKNHTSDSQKPITGIFDKQGHRGCRGLLPENTIAAMLHALGLGISTLEMDVVVTKDKKLILSHEPFFNHEISTKPDGSPVTEAEEKSLNIYRMDYETVKTYDVGMKPHPRFPRQEKLPAFKPLLSKVLDAVKNYMMTARRPYPFFNIETKCTASTDDLYHPKPAEFVELLMTLIRERQLEEQVIIQSFDIRSLQYLHEHYPSVKTALLVEGEENKDAGSQIKKLGFTPTIYSPEFILVSPALIKSCHEKGVQVIPWTVNEKTEIEKLKEMGVDGIITDYPDLF
jgi:glycerophosphoryl diester phosphodiesterase